MPWTAEDAHKFTHAKNLNPQQWAKVANSVLHETGDDAKAIRIANAKAKGHG